MSSPTTYNQNPLLFLADVSLRLATTEQVTADNIGTSPISSPETTISSLPDPEYNSDDTLVSNCSPIKAHKKSKVYHTRATSNAASFSRNSSKGKRLQLTRPLLQAKARVRSKRVALAKKAAEMPTVMNSPVNEVQYAVLRLIFDEVTPYPPEPFMNVLAVTLRRSFRQIKNWFSNERQKKTVVSRTLFNHSTETGEVLRLRPESIICHNWTDDFFEELVCIHYLKFSRIFHFEAEQKDDSEVQASIVTADDPCATDNGTSD